MDDSLAIDQEIDAVAEVVAEGPVDNGRAKRNCLVFILIVGLIAGFFYGIGPDESDYQIPIDFASSFIITFAVLAWCYLDGEERNFNFSRKCSICFVFFPYICFPWYILKVRKGMACLKIFVLAVLFFVLYLIACGLGYALGLLMSYVF
ncbi:MAG: hypothetical protein FVQ82_00200 [Planctomycetes bacterium]|nr:hypothetical protein [Planctomycetota bacterium]